MTGRVEPFAYSFPSLCRVYGKFGGLKNFGYFDFSMLRRVAAVEQPVATYGSDAPWGGNVKVPSAAEVKNLRW